MIALAILAVVSLTIPATECPNGTPERMGYILFRVRPVPEAAVSESVSLPCAGLEGARVEWTMPSRWDGKYLDALGIDAAGNRACAPSLPVLLQPAVSVPGDPEAPPRVTYYDVTGRRLDGRPRVPGVYFSRTGRKGAGRVVVIR